MDEPKLEDVLKRNIQALIDVRKKYDTERSAEEKVADRITAFVGSLPFVYVHIALFGGWIILNSGMIVNPPDPFPFVMLAMFASVEAIFVSTFVLISQNRMGEIVEKRADLDVQVGLLMEHELTQLVRLVEQIARRLQIDSSLEEIKKDMPPDVVLGHIEEVQRHDQNSDTNSSA